MKNGMIIMKQMEFALISQPRRARMKIIILFLIFSFIPQIHAEDIYVTSLQNLSLAQKKGITLQTVSKNQSGLVAVKMTEKQRKTFAQVMHEEKHTCGGYTFAGTEYKADLLDQSLAKIFNFADFPVFDNKEIKNQVHVNKVRSLLSADRYKNYIQNLTDFPDRAASSNNGVAASTWIMDEVTRIKESFKAENLSAFYVSNSRYPQKSVVVTLEGLSAEKPGLVLGAHMDTLKRNKPGADDDASGSAAVLEVLQAVLSSKVKLDRSIYFILYSAEEVGLVGSRSVVNHFKNNKMQVEAVMQLDMIGYQPTKSIQKMHFVTDNTNVSLNNYVKQLAKVYLNKTDAQLLDLKCGYSCSDHARWHSAGFPATFPFESSFSDHNRSIHTSRDTISLVNIDHAMQFVHLAAAFVIELGEPLN